ADHRSHRGQGLPTTVMTSLRSGSASPRAVSVARQATGGSADLETGNALADAAQLARHHQGSGTLRRRTGLGDDAIGQAVEPCFQDEKAALHVAEFRAEGEYAVAPFLDFASLPDLDLRQA